MLCSYWGGGITGAFGGEETFSIDFRDPLEILFLLALAIAGLSGIDSFFTGLISILKYKERSVPVFLATAIGLYVLFIALGESLSMIGILPSH